MNNKGTKGLFFFQQTDFFAHIISHKQSTNHQKQSQNDVFHVETSPNLS